MSKTLVETLKPLFRFPQSCNLTEILDFDNSVVISEKDYNRLMEIDADVFMAADGNLYSFGYRGSEYVLVPVFKDKCLSYIGGLPKDGSSKAYLENFFR